MTLIQKAHLRKLLEKGQKGMFHNVATWTHKDNIKNQNGANHPSYYHLNSGNRHYHQTVLS